MGWGSHDLPNKDYKLWTRGGTNGVYIQNVDGGPEIEVPSELIKMLVAEDIRSKRIGDYEQMETDELLGV